MIVPERDRIRLQIAALKIRLAQLDLQAAQEEKLVADLALRRMGLTQGEQVDPYTGEVTPMPKGEAPSPAEVRNGS